MISKARAARAAAVAFAVAAMAQVAQPVPSADTETAAETAVQTEYGTNGMAGIAAVMTEYETQAYDAIASASAEVGQTGVIVVSSAQTDEEAETAAETAEAALSEEELIWQNRLMADVNEYLNVRASGDENAEIVGKLYKGDVAEIVEAGETWTHIASGNVDGYVNNAYCVTGMEAYAYATANFDTEAEVTAAGLRVRSEADENSSVITALAEGTVLTVDSDAQAQDGWVAVEYGGKTRYVSAEYVTLSLALGEAITIEEEQEELARLAAEEAARKAAQTTEVTTVQNAAVDANTDEVTLLAALIQCEAGNEIYEGQVAVGAVVMNRLRSGAYGSSIYEVIYQKGQFTPAGSGSVAKVVANGPKDSCIQAAQEAINGTDNTGGARSFRRASSGHAGVVIGNHVFY